MWPAPMPTVPVPKAVVRTGEAGRGTRSAALRLPRPPYLPSPSCFSENRFSLGDL